MADFLYNIIIFPIVQIIELVYVLIFRIFHYQSISIIGVSVAVTLLCLPLYIMAEHWQETERGIIKKLKPKINKIRAVFKGDEQYMILSAYYRQNHYHPIYALRSSFGILIQIPFFIAAYTFLSHLDAIKGVGFLFIKDLGEPDAIAKTGNLVINILPVLMTLINIVSGFIYTRGLSLKDKLQVYLTAAVFLILLYNSPSGLVLYWTMNNVFSLIKNIFYKLKNPIKILYIVFDVFILVFVFYLLFINPGLLIKRIILSLISLIFLFMPLFVKFIFFIYHKYFKNFNNNDRNRNILFFSSCIIITILAGIYIPGTVMASSPEEFSFIDSFQSPFVFIYYAVTRSMGLFLFWPLCIYFFFGKTAKSLLTVIFTFLGLAAVIHVFFFQGNYGFISNTFNFSTTAVLVSSKISIITNILSLFLVFFLLFFIFTKTKLRIVNVFGIIIAVSISVLSINSLIKIGTEYHKYTELRGADFSSYHKVESVFSLSKTKPNIIVIMSDCAINGFVKPVFNEHPRLKDIFTGFTLYTNTLSFAGHTIMGVPPIWGGYEYTPLEMNKRDSVPLVDKHNEALMILPELFQNAGFQITITDPSFANYSNVPDTRIFDKYENIKAFNINGRYTNNWYMEHNQNNKQVTGNTIIKNVLWFSFLKISPVFLRSIIYYDGTYLSTAFFSLDITKFINSYAVLGYLPQLTAYDAEAPSALLITNETTHELVYLQYPDYTPSDEITTIGTGEFKDNNRFHVNTAFYLKLGDFLEELKKNGVYDNTRIIIVSDHGANIDAGLTDTDISIPDERREFYNPVLLVKDFNAQGELKFSTAFMTNADVPLIATKNIIDNPVNPFTGKALTDAPKSNGVFITTNHLPNQVNHGKYTFKITKDQWVFVHDDILEKDNWTKREPW
ncbi:membrane protein [Spirochaetia bacterium]|nr:membrane protein [Spirochaetia bacterium]